MATFARTPMAGTVRPDSPPREVRRPRDRVASIVLHVVLVLGLLVMVGPFVWMLVSAIKPEPEIRLDPPTWWPHHPTLEHFGVLLGQLDFPQYFLNSAVVAVGVTVGNVFLCAALGYAVAKLEFPGKRVLFMIVLGTLMVPGVVTFVPQFVLVSKLGLINTYAGLILPALAVAGPFGVFLMRQFMLGIPTDLLEAARMDGAGEFRIFFQVVLPLCRPVMATLGILTFLGSWNNFLWPLVAATTEDKYTLPVALALYSTGQNKIYFGLTLAGAVAVVVPVLIVFMLLQRHFIRGIATTGLK